MKSWTTRWTTLAAAMAGILQRVCPQRAQSATQAHIPQPLESGMLGLEAQRWFFDAMRMAEQSLGQDNSTCLQDKAGEGYMAFGQ